MNHLRATTLAVGLTALSAVSAQAQSLTVETGTASGLTTLAMQVIATYGGTDLQINSGQTLTRSCLKLGQAQIDVAVCPPPAFAALSRGVGPYRENPDEAVAASANVRSLFGISGGMFHFIVGADSGIESWDDLVGRRVFTGPPAGTANQQSQTIIRAASGLIADVDYESVRVGWGAAIQGYQDGQFDMLVFPTVVGNSVLEQIGPFTLLPLSDAALATEAWAEWAASDARQPGVIPAGIYSNATNQDDITAAEYFMMIAVNASMDDDTAYELTRQFWSNLEQATGDIALLASINADRPLQGVNAPLHPGALRYYEEMGVEIPAALR